MKIIIEDLVVPGYTYLQPRGIDDAADIIVLMGVSTAPGHQMVEALWYSQLTDEVTVIPDLLPTDPIRLTGISSNGQICCGYDKGVGSAITWQPGLGKTVYDSIVGYKYARPMAINNAKDIVGFLQNSGGGAARVGMFKKNNQTMKSFTHPNAHQVTEFTSLNNSGVAIGITDTDYIFEFNVNTEQYTDISFPAIAAVARTSSSTIPQMIEGLDYQKANLNEKSQIIYTFFDTTSNVTKAVILNKDSGLYNVLEIPSFENDNIFITGSNSSGKLIGINQTTSKPFIVSIIHEVDVLTIPYKNLIQDKTTNKMYIGIDLDCEAFPVNPTNNDIIPIKITVEMGQLLTEGATVIYKFEGDAEVKEHTSHFHYYIK